MGGDYYDRPVISTKVVATKVSNVSKPISSYSKPPTFGNNVVGKTNRLNELLDPKNHIQEKQQIVCENFNPIVFALDVTGSMGEWPKIIYDKFPMFYGQIKMKNYLKDPAISFCAIGDVTSDKAALQVTQFGQGKQIDQLIAKMWLEGGGGGNQHESYQLSAFFYSHYVQLKSPQLSFFFVTGDQAYFKSPPTKLYTKFLGVKLPEQNINSKAQWKKLMNVYNVFHIKKEYYEENYEQKIYKQWVQTLGEERILKIVDPKAIIDVVLGAIAITSGTRTLATYIKDMEQRGQDEQRIIQVSTTLEKYSQAIQKKKIIPVSASQNKYRQQLSCLRQKYNKQIPQNYCCPITGQILYDPVMTVDGQTYERQAIVDWLKEHNTSPLTNIELQNKNLIPNILVKKLIRQFYDSHIKKEEEKIKQ